MEEEQDNEEDKKKKKQQYEQAKMNGRLKIEIRGRLHDWNSNSTI